MHQLILASQSPRRKKLITDAGYKFRTDLVKVSEIIKENLSLRDSLVDLARQKSVAYRTANKSLESQKILLLTADTVVVFEGQILLKPKDGAEATDFLQRMSGKKHQVYSSMCLYDFETLREITTLEVTEIEFRELSNEEIDEYVATGDPLDKAGAYGIQSGGGKFVEAYHGSFSNVMGLPLERLEELLNENGIEIEKVTQ